MVIKLHGPLDAAGFFTCRKQVQQTDVRYRGAFCADMPYKAPVSADSAKKQSQCRKEPCAEYAG